MKECCQTCKLRYEAHQTDFRKLGTDEHIDSIIDDAFICMAFAYEGIANLMIGTDPNLGLCEVYTPKTEQTEPQRGCDADCTEDCNECAKETELWKAEQTEPNSSEFPNNSTISKMEQVDKDINVRSKDEPKICEWCKFYDGENCFSQEPCKVMLYLKDEPQTDCPWK